jgi:quercetin dioxygenase-like cupin family protein
MATTATSAKTAQPLDPGFPKGRFHLAKAKDADWQVGLRRHFAYRDLGIHGATDGKVLAQVIRARQPCDGPGDEHTHSLDFQMVYVLKGWVRFESEDIGAVELRPGDCVHQPPRVRHREVAHSDDLELIEITGPAEFATSLVEDPPR